MALSGRGSEVASKTVRSRRWRCPYALCSSGGGEVSLHGDQSEGAAGSNDRRSGT
jgi:hypothetical protein